MSSNEDTTRAYSAPAAACAADTLLMLARSPASLTITQLANALGVTRSMVFRVCQELLTREFLVRDESGGYSLGYATLDVGGAFAAAFDQEDSMRTALKHMAQSTGASVGLAVLRGTEVMHLVREDPPGAKLSIKHLVAMIPANCTALGKALLTRLTDEEIGDRFSSGLATMTSNSVGSLPQLIDEVRLARATGFAEQREEVVVGRSSVAIPIDFSFLGEPAAIGLACSATQYEETREELVDALRACEGRLAREAQARAALPGANPSDHL